MSTPSTFPIKLSDVKTEFSGPNTMRSYLIGNSYVANHENNASVPSSGTLFLSNFKSTATYLVDKDFEGLTYSDGANTIVYPGPPPYYSFETDYLYGFANIVSSGPPIYSYICGAAGTIDRIGVSKSSTSQYTLVSVLDYIFDDGSSTSYFGVSGNHTGWNWTSVTANGVTKFRANCTSVNGSYQSATDTTLWAWSQGFTPDLFGFDGSGTFDVRVVVP